VLIVLAQGKFHALHADLLEKLHVQPGSAPLKCNGACGIPKEPQSDGVVYVL
jgi:hypothetical protein